ncbi:hypothetical protein [Aquimarina algiphila]|uniref:hypothetical protein n=1 Tax=Aquimarina algiphila TaxID=2047982 RepID=UPI00232E977B|nr:hypothetical protein [Aquimarina algiphila]
MDKVVYLLLMMVLFSCKTTGNTQEKKEEQNYQKKEVENQGSNVNTPIIKKPTYISSQDPINPGTVHLIASVAKITKDASICGKSYKATVTVKVNSVKGSGSGIVNMISAGQEITFGIRKYMAEDFEVLKQKLIKDQEFFFIVEEGLCRNMSQTAYVVSSFKVIN